MFFSGLFQRKSDAPVTTPAELADAIGLSYDTYIWGDTVVECVLNKLCPSHTYVIFKYPE
ncbi:hypothetical protein D9I53_21870 [Escherichia coli]|nr:hypothetical protein [Escherichia coli]MHV39283.1 hypothetical protein [Escherichia coli]